MKRTKYIFAIIVSTLFATCAFAQTHPRLIVADDDVQDLKNSEGKYQLWDATTLNLKEEMDAILEMDCDVPVPVDPAGGYTHEKHKKNGQMLKKLGLQYQLSSDVKYANYSKEIFLKYADLYPTVELHPVEKSYARGRLFWQQLNEAVFLCDVIEGYDAICMTLTKKERKIIEQNFLLAMADFLSIETPYVFNKIHNHGVWAVAAVGMTGMVLDNEELIARAFYGIDEDGKPMQSEVDGFGNSPFGFFTQTKELFSPNGYYTEGPYYQRYAMTPFLLFAQSIHQNYPDMGVFEFENGIFIHAVETLIDLTDEKGEFFPINDHLKGMGMKAPSMVWALDFLYARTKNPQILELAKMQGVRSISMGGLEISKGIAENKEAQLVLDSKIIADGSNGDKGGIGVIRNKELTTVFKFATQGLNHGHFDRLNLIHYHNGSEVLTDYGAARYVNVKAKEGGRYLPENNTYAKQTIAHNTLVVDQKSNFGGNYKQSKDVHSDLIFSDLENDDLIIFAAQELNAYQDVKMKRVVAQVNHKDYAEPLLVDVFIADAQEKHQYDLPFHFLGEIIETQFDCKAMEQLSPLGDDQGYEHLWKMASGSGLSNNAGFTWMNNRVFYSLTTSIDQTTELIFTRTGANDPSFNLRAEPTFIVRQPNTSDHVFATVVECHGYNNANTEIVSNQQKMTESVSVEELIANVFAMKIITKMGSELSLVVNLNEEPVSVDIEGSQYDIDNYIMK